MIDNFLSLLKCHMPPIFKPEGTDISNQWYKEPELKVIFPHGTVNNPPVSTTLLMMLSC